MLLTCLAILSVAAAVLICLLAGVSFWWLPLLLLGCFLGAAALAFGFLWLMCAIVDTNKPQEVYSKFYQKLAKVYIKALVPIVQVRIHKRGLEQLPKEVKSERFERLLALQNEIAKEKNQPLVGKPMRVLCDGVSKTNPSVYSGRTEGNKIVFFEGSEADTGSFVTVVADRADAFAFYGKKTENN